MTARPWATVFGFDSLGTVVRIRSTDGRLGEAVQIMFRHFPVSAGEPAVEVSVTHHEDEYRVESDGEVIVDGGSWDKALLWTLAVVNRITIREMSHLAFHAGAVASGDEVIAFPASGRTGKSTLVAACLQQGFDYVSDEAVVVAGDGVLPYPKALWLSGESRRALGLDDTSLLVPLREEHRRGPVLPEELGGRIATPPLRLVHLVVPQRGKGPARLRRIGRGDAATRIVAHAFGRSERPEDWFRVAAGLARGAEAWVLSYRDATEAAATLRRLVG